MVNAPSTTLQFRPGASNVEKHAIEHFSRLYNPDKVEGDKTRATVTQALKERRNAVMRSKGFFSEGSDYKDDGTKRLIGPNALTALAKDPTYQAFLSEILQYEIAIHAVEAFAAAEPYWESELFKRKINALEHGQDHSSYANIIEKLVANKQAELHSTGYNIKPSHDISRN